MDVYGSQDEIFAWEGSYEEEDSEFYEDDEPEDESVWEEGAYYHQYLSVSGYSGVAFFCDGDNGVDVRAHMVGDDRGFVFDRRAVSLLPRESFCGSCGQIGCSHDGLDRENV